MFSLDDFTAAKLTSVNPRAEGKGADKVPAADLKFEIQSSNDILSEFGPQLRDSFYWNSGESTQGELIEGFSDKPNLRNPMLGPVKLTTELAGYFLTVDGGLGGKSNIQLDDCAVNDFRVDMQEGGTVALAFRVQCHPSEKEMGRLCMLVQQEVRVLLRAPATVTMELRAA